jgi:hypothetical protein
VEGVSDGVDDSVVAAAAGLFLTEIRSIYKRITYAAGVGSGFGSAGFGTTFGLVTIRTMKPFSVIWYSSTFFSSSRILPY